jgi:hypothetical protein
MKRMAFKKTHNRFGAPFAKPILCHGLKSVFGTGRIKPAAGGFERREIPAIHPD